MKELDIIIMTLEALAVKDGLTEKGLEHLRGLKEARYLVKKNPTKRIK